MKRFLQCLLLIILFSATGIILTNQETFRQDVQAVRQKYIDKPCSKPIRYSIGTVDPRFGISQSDFQNTTAQAEKVWEDPTGKNLFEYDAGSDFKINLIYDERQKTTDEVEKMENQLSSLELKHDEVTQEYNSLSAESKKKISSYNKALEKYKDDLDDYNKEVAVWNSRGGAPEDEFNKLKEEKKDLENTYKSLEKQRKEVNSLIQQANALAQKSNQVAQNYNSNLNTYKNQFGESREFDKGIYDGSSIDIYQFDEIADLRLALAHELGHALGLDHLSEPQSIMYYLMGEQDLENPKMSDEDISALKKICKL